MSLANLPEELFSEIVSCLSTPALRALARTSKALYARLHPQIAQSALTDYTTLTLARCDGSCSLHLCRIPATRKASGQVVRRLLLVVYAEICWVHGDWVVEKSKLGLGKRGVRQGGGWEIVEQEGTECKCRKPGGYCVNYKEPGSHMTFLTDFRVLILLKPKISRPGPVPEDGKPPRKVSRVKYALQQFVDGLRPGNGLLRIQVKLRTNAPESQCTVDKLISITPFKLAGRTLDPYATTFGDLLDVHSIGRVVSFRPQMSCPPRALQSEEALNTTAEDAAMDKIRNGESLVDSDELCPQCETRAADRCELYRQRGRMMRLTMKNRSSGPMELESRREYTTFPSSALENPTQQQGILSRFLQSSIAEKARSRSQKQAEEAFIKGSFTPSRWVSNLDDACRFELHLPNPISDYLSSSNIQQVPPVFFLAHLHLEGVSISYHMSSQLRWLCPHRGKLVLRNVILLRQDELVGSKVPREGAGYWIWFALSAFKAGTRVKSCELEMLKYHPSSLRPRINHPNESDQYQLVTEQYLREMAGLLQGNPIIF